MLSTNSKLAITYLFSCAMLISISTTSYAESLFFKGQNNGWEVNGIHQREKLNPVCRADKNYNDGSQFSLIKDLADNELYIVLVNNSWNITDPPGQYSARINFHSGNRVSGAQMTYELLNKNTIRVRNIVQNRFVPDFMNYSKMVVIMPGTIPNAEINLSGSSNMISLMAQCTRVYVPGNNKPGTSL